MTITDALMGEHGVLYMLMDHLEEGLDVPASLEAARARAAVLAKAVCSHADLEDQLLFSRLEEAIGPEGPLTVMRMEHDAIEAEFAQLSARATPDEIRAGLRRVIDVARGHFGKEEAILFPLAQQVLGEGVLIGLGEQWRDRRGVDGRAARCFS